MAAIIPDGRFVQVVKREQVPLETIWEPEDKARLGLENNWFKQTYNVNSIIDYDVALSKVEGGVVTAEQWEWYNNPAAKIEANLDRIEQHVDRRIQLFFMQLICCYRTPYHFEWVGANDEYGKGNKITVKNPNGRGTKKVDTEAAHSGTFPCLMAYPKAEWEQGNKANGFVYLKYGRSYLDNNGTVEFEKYLNGADTLIDGKGEEKKLRNAVIEVLNANAEGKYGPTRGIREFARLFEEHVIKSQRFLAEKKKKLASDHTRSLILNRYLARIQEVKFVLDNDPGYCDQLLGVKVGDHPREAALRDIVYRKRFKLIQDCEAIESQIARTILTSQNAMLGKHNTSLKNVDYRLRYILLEDVNPTFKKCLEKLFCTSLAQLQADIERNEERLRAFERTERISNFRTQHGPAIENLKRDLRAHFRALDNLELSYRSELFKGLRRDLNRWYQKDFVPKYKAKYPNDSMSNSMVSRLEQRTRAIGEERAYKTPLNQRRKDITEQKAIRIADTFGVDAGLFLPAVVSSAY